MLDDSKIFQLYLEAAYSQQLKAIVDKRGTKRWYLNDRLHRMDGPAVECADGSKEWWMNGKIHRDGAPAVELADGTKKWYQHDKLHREDGPAVEFKDWINFWYLNDSWFDTPEKWAEELLKQRKQPHDAAAVDAFLKTILKKDIEQAL